MSQPLTGVGKVKTFEQFKDMLAYNCMLAINECDVIIGKDCCPLGSSNYTDNPEYCPRWPTFHIASKIYNISNNQAMTFISGFDNDFMGGRYMIEFDGSNEKFFNLGQAYRTKFR